MKRCIILLISVICLLAACTDANENVLATTPAVTPESAASEPESSTTPQSEPTTVETEPVDFELPTYPENFLHMIPLPDADEEYEPLIESSGEDANGPCRIAYYGDYYTYEILYNNDSWARTQRVYINNNYITSEGISVGSTKTDVINAYEKYGLKEYDMPEITNIGLDTLDIVIMGENLADTFLYIDNGYVFEEGYTGIDYWGGLGAFIFIIDFNGDVTKIVSYAPTSG